MHQLVIFASGLVARARGVLKQKGNTGNVDESRWRKSPNALRRSYNDELAAWTQVEYVEFKQVMVPAAI